MKFLLCLFNTKTCLSFRWNSKRMCILNWKTARNGNYCVIIQKKNIAQNGKASQRLYTKIMIEQKWNCSNVIRFKYCHKERRKEWLLDTLPSIDAAQKFKYNNIRALKRDGVQNYNIIIMFARLRSTKLNCVFNLPNYLWWILAEELNFEQTMLHYYHCH